MRALGRTFSRFEQILTLENGSRVRGSIQTAREGVSGLSNFLETRLTLHCRPAEPVVVGAVGLDQHDRRFLIAEHDRTVDVAVYKLFPVTSHVQWRRPSTMVDVVTGLPRGGAPVDMGMLWVALELYGRTEVDRSMHVQTERTRLLTGEGVRLNDTIDGLMVRRVYSVYGISVAEIQ